MSIEKNRLKNLRELNGFSQSQVSDYLEIDQSYLSKIENGERKLTLSLINKLSNLYNCSHEYLLGEDDFYKQPNISFKSKDKVDLNAISKMNEVKKYLELLRSIGVD